MIMDVITLEMFCCFRLDKQSFTGHSIVSVLIMY